MTARGAAAARHRRRGHHQRSGVGGDLSEDGAFEIQLITGGAVVQLQIPAINFQKQFAVPPRPAPGVPVRLFSI